MFLAAATAAQSSFNFDPFDIFMIVFTVLIFMALLNAKKHNNKFAMGFSAVALLVFLFTDLIMVLNWFNLLDNALAMVGL